MKKVVCIDDSEFNINRSPKVRTPSVGDIVTVAKAYLDIFDNNDPVYDFVEYPNHMFSQRYFAELDGDLDETELVTEEFEEKYCLPVNSNVCV